MNLTNETIQKISKGEYAFDFLKITLTQKKAEQPKIYSGSGSVTYDKNGELILKMYHLFSDDQEALKELTDDFSRNTEPGQLISNEYYYEMCAIDVIGNTWTSDFLSLNADITIPSNGKVITSRVRSIQLSSDEASSNSNFKLALFTNTKIKFPKNARDETLSYSNFNKCVVEKSDFELSIKKVDDELVLINATLKDKHANEISAKLLTEALCILFGRYIRPLVKIENDNGKQIITIFSQSDKTDNKSIISPIPIRAPTDTKNIAEFVDSYMNYFNESISPFFGYWFRILDATNSHIENQGLIVTTSIEGVLKNYFNSSGKPDIEILKDAEQAGPIIKLLKISERLKARLLANLGNLKGFTAKNALHNLKDKKKVTKEMLDAWSKLRNKCAHADQLKNDEGKLQEFLDQNFACLGLFYMLLFIKLNYRGAYTDLSCKSWPEKVIA